MYVIYSIQYTLYTQKCYAKEQVYHYNTIEQFFAIVLRNCNYLLKGNYCFISTLSLCLIDILFFFCSVLLFNI